MQVVADGDARAGPEELGVAEDEARRQQLVFQHLARAVEIAEQPIQQQRPLDDAAFDRAPLFGLEHERKKIEAPLPARVAIVEGGERDVVLHHEPVRLVLRRLSRVDAHAGERLEHCLPPRPHLAAAARELVECD